MNSRLPVDIRSRISQQMLERYSARYEKLGYDVKTLGWGTVEQQQYRFAQTLAMGVDFSEKRVVDIGCGFGDFVDFLTDLKIPFASYVGLDINPNLIQEAMKRHKGNTAIEFQVVDLLAPSSSILPLGDVGIMLGMLNLNLGKEADNYDYTKDMVESALHFVKDVLIVDFISVYKTKNYPAEGFIFYHDPSFVLKHLFSFSHNIALKHDYLPIPQKEFMVALFKGD